MSREEVKKLLGGYATGTLTPEEQQVLFEAALEDQELFDALAKEQPLRDLLRDPAAKAEVLAALDGPPARGAGWLAWMRRPWVAGLAMAGLAAVGVTIWQANRGREAAPTIIAELRREPPQAPPQTQAPQAGAQPPAMEQDKEFARPSRQVPPVSKVKARTASNGRRDIAAAPPVAPPPAPASRDFKDSIAPAAAAPSQPVVTAQIKAAESQSGAVQQNAQNMQAPSPNNASQMAQNLAVAPKQELKTLDDARALFYGGNSFAPVDAITERARKKATFAAVTPVALGVRCSILRDGNQEVDLSTPLFAGETVKLRIVPNADGFLYVTEGGKPIASAAVKRNQRFETQELKRDDPGRRDLQVVLSRLEMRGGVVGGVAGFTTGALTAPRANLVETTSGADRATYVVNGSVAPPPQIVAPIVLTWR
jgi:hypothetical protein